MSKHHGSHHSIKDGSATWIHWFEFGRAKLEAKHYLHTGALPDRHVYQISFRWDRKKRHTQLPQLPFSKQKGNTQPQ